MDTLDSDESLLRSFNDLVAKKDIVLFIEFNGVTFFNFVRFVILLH